MNLKNIWYYEHQLPTGYKAYSKTKPIQLAEFDKLKTWWHQRQANQQAWSVDIASIKANGYNLDIEKPPPARSRATTQQRRTPGPAPAILQQKRSTLRATTHRTTLIPTINQSYQQHIKLPPLGTEFTPSKTPRLATTAHQTTLIPTINQVYQ